MGTPLKMTVTAELDAALGVPLRAIDAFCGVGYSVPASPMAVGGMSTPPCFAR